MSPVPSAQQRSPLALQVGTLALSPTEAPNPMGVVRAAAWHNQLLRLGLPLPLFLVHDLGLLLTSGDEPSKRISNRTSVWPPPKAIAKRSAS